MNRPLISIIMPVYRVELFVAKAIESLQKQSYGNFELVIVDDGSPDKSGEICDSYAKKDNRIKVIHKKNEGAPSARNLALSMIKGKYVYFMDSDDWCESTMLEDMLNLAEKNNSELVVTGFYIDTYYSDKKYGTQHINCPSKIYDNKDDFRKDAYKYFDNNLLYTPWNKLFLFSRIKELNISFKNTIMDDFPFVLDYIKDVNRVVISENMYYHFLRARSESETQKYRPTLYEKRQEEHKWLEDLYRHWNLDTKIETKEFLSRRYLERLIECIENVTNVKSKLTKKEQKLKIKEMISSPKIKEMIEVAKPNTLILKLVLLPLKIQSVNWAYFQSRFITFVRKHNLKLFTMLKNKRKRK